MLDYPKETEVDKVIAKEKFYNFYDMKTLDKNIFTNDIKQIRWLHSFQRDNLNIDLYSDEEKEYSGIEVIQVTLKKSTNKLERIAEIIHRIMPNPLILVFKHKNKILISVAHKRNSKADNDKITLTDMRYTPWMNEDFLGEFDEKLFDKLNMNNLDKTNFYKMYSSIVNAVIITNGSREVGQDVTVPIEKIHEINNKIYFINLDIKKLEAELKRETQFKRQTDLNMKIHDLTEKKKKLRRELI